MGEAREAACDVAKAACDALRCIGDVSYAVLPRDIAHAVGDLNKACLNSLRSAIDCQIEWIDERVAGGDRLREEWQRACERTQSPGTAEPGAV